MENDDLWKLICIQYSHINHIIITRTPLISYFSMTFANPTSSLGRIMTLKKCSLEARKRRTKRKNLQLTMAPNIKNHRWKFQENFYHSLKSVFRSVIEAWRKWIWIKSVSWEYSCNEEYLEEFDKEKIEILVITGCTPTKQTWSNWIAFLLNG